MGMGAVCLTRTLLERNQELQERLRVLHIDDNPADRALAGIVLSRELPQAVVEAATCASDFARAMTDLAFDIVALDCRLSWGDSLDILKLIRDRRPDVPVIFFTRPVPAGFEKRILEASPDDLILKTSAGFLRLASRIRTLWVRTKIAKKAVATERRLTTVLEHSNKGYFRANMFGRLLDVSPTLQRMLGRESPRRGRGWPELPLFFAAQERSAVLERVRKGGRSHQQDVEIHLGERSSIWVHLTETVVRAENGQLCIDGLVEDISEKKKETEDLARSNRDLDDFASIASHELQEPLRMVERYTQILSEEHGGELHSDARDYLRMAHEGALRMQSLVDDLLEFSRIESRASVFTECASSEFVEEALIELRQQIDESNASVELEDLPTVTADPRQMAILFRNLISNGLKFTRGPDPRIVISGERQSDEVSFSVQDNGIGIDSEQLSRIFGLFKRLNPEIPGTGIGLAICQRIVERHKGRIWVESKPGEGSRFRIAIPVSPGA